MVELVPAGVLDDGVVPARAPATAAVGGLPVPPHRAAQHDVGAEAAGGQRRTEHAGTARSPSVGELVVVGGAAGRLAVPDQQAARSSRLASSMSRWQRVLEVAAPSGRKRA